MLEGYCHKFAQKNPELDPDILRTVRTYIVSVHSLRKCWQDMFTPELRQVSQSES